MLKISGAMSDGNRDGERQRALCVCGGRENYDNPIVFDNIKQNLHVIFTSMAMTCVQNHVEPVDFAAE